MVLDPIPPGTFRAIERIIRQLEYIFRVMVDRTLWTNGRLPTHAVTGGIPSGAESHDPRGLERHRRATRDEISGASAAPRSAR